MATVNKDFRIKAGLVVEGTNATVDGEDIITTGSSTDDLQEGSTNLYFTNQRALDAVGGDISSAVSTAIDALDTDDIEEGSTNLYYTDARVDSHLSGTYPIEYNAGDISLAIGEGGGLTTDEGGLYINRTTVDAWYDAAGAATTAEGNANDYTDTALESYTPTGDLDVTVGGYGYLKSADLSSYATESYVNTAVDNLVDGAPGLLDTLNEIAAAIADDENYATTMTTALAGKQNSLTAGTNISIVSDTISVTGLASTDISDFNTAALSATSSAYDAAGAASSAQSAAESYTDTAINGLDTDAIEEGSNLYFTDERAIDAVSGADIYPNAVIVNNVSKAVANTQSVSTASTVSGLTWAKADYKSAKLVVKAATATHSQVSEIMVTLDSSDNVAITEFGIVYTDAELATVTADVSGTDVRVRVTTLNASTTVTVVGTLLI
jgi:hypothetical protein